MWHNNLCVVILEIVNLQKYIGKNHNQDNDWNNNYCFGQFLSTKRTGTQWSTFVGICQTMITIISTNINITHDDDDYITLVDKSRKMVVEDLQRLEVALVLEKIN